MRRGKSRQLSQFLDEARKLALDAVSNWDPDSFLLEDDEVIVQHVLATHWPTPVSIEWEDMTRTSIGETTMRVRDQFFPDTVHEVPASTLTIRVPIKGDPKLLEYDASQSYLADIPGEIGRDTLFLVVKDRQVTKSTVDAAIESAQQSWGSIATWANNDIQQHAPVVESSVRDAVAHRRSRLLADRELDAALPIPLRPVGEMQSVPVTPKPRYLPVESRRGTAKFAPEPAIDDAIYADIIRQCRDWARGVERSPKTTQKFDEEELRDQLLIMLNSHWQGNATGETFNGNGKTDILVRESGRNVFIAECKFWRGPKGAGDAIDQLLGYLVWRDTKAALIVFIRNKNVSDAIGKLHESVASHESCRATVPGGKPSECVEYIFESNDEGRRIRVSVLPVAIPRPDGNLT